MLARSNGPESWPTGEEGSSRHARHGDSLVYTARPGARSDVPVPGKVSVGAVMVVALQEDEITVLEPRPYVELQALLNSMLELPCCPWGDAFERVVDKRDEVRVPEGDAIRLRDYRALQAVESMTTSVAVAKSAERIVETVEYLVVSVRR
jgi:hypothetical protein